MSRIIQREYKNVKAQPVAVGKKVYRNDPCPCGATKIIVDQNNQEFERPIKNKHHCNVKRVE